MMWEILTNATVPYAAMNNQEAFDFVNSGKRLDKPIDCSDSLYAIMQQCWSVEPNQRPSFEQLATQLRSFAKGYPPAPKNSSSNKPTNHYQSLESSL